MQYRPSQHCTHRRATYTREMGTHRQHCMVARRIPRVLLDEKHDVASTCTATLPTLHSEYPACAARHFKAECCTCRPR